MNDDISIHQNHLHFLATETHVEGMDSLIHVELFQF